MEVVSNTDIQKRLAAKGYYKGKIDGDIGPMSYGAMFSWAVSKDLGDKFGSAANKYFPLFGLTTNLRLAHFLAQTAEETGFTNFEESLYYTSPERVHTTFSSRFPTVASAIPYLRKPAALANRAYSLRMGNGDEKSGDGYKYRGRGMIQTTGRTNYQQAGAALNLDLINHPELAITPDGAVGTAAYYWFRNKINTYADADDILALSRAVNLGDAHKNAMPANYQRRVDYLKHMKELLT